LLQYGKEKEGEGGEEADREGRVVRFNLKKGRGIGGGFT
jgi:hypothetical protein